MGGGAAYGALSSCFITGNSADYNGGGAYNCSLTNCTVTRNSASSSGGGIYVESSYPSISSLNCLIYFNNATRGSNYDGIGNSMSYCCTTPAAYGSGNMGSDPVLADSVSYTHLTLPTKRIV